MPQITTTKLGGRRYRLDYTDLCRNCFGSGEILPAYPENAKPIECGVCNGTGYVDIQKQILVIVKPSKTKTNDSNP